MLLHSSLKIPFCLYSTINYMKTLDNQIFLVMLGPEALLVNPEVANKFKARLNSVLPY